MNEFLSTEYPKFCVGLSLTIPVKYIECDEMWLQCDKNVKKFKVCEYF